jgi:hypothetical protein
VTGRNIRDSLSGVGMLLVIAGLAFVVGHCSGCAPREYAPLPAYCYEEALLQAKYLRCVDASATREESRLCRLEVDRTCGFKVTR